MMAQTRADRRLLGALGCLFVTACLCAHASQVLVSVAGRDITSDDLDQAIASSPFAAAFPTLDEDVQARTRGDMLQRLVNAELLYQEGKALGLEQSDAFRREMATFRRGLAYQAFTTRLRPDAAVPPQVNAQLRETYAGDGDALEAARSMYVAPRYQALKTKRIQALQSRYQVRVYPDRLADAHPETMLAEGDGILIRGADLSSGNAPSPEVLEERVEMELVARDVSADSIELASHLDDYRHLLLARLTLEAKERAWVPDDAALRAYFAAHPDLGQVPARWHVAQIVVPTQSEAQDLRARVFQGESLFRLAAKHSIDPEGRKNSGDLGWVRQGQGMPELEAAIAGLEDGEVSPVVKTSKGYHVVMVVERRPGQQKPFEAVRDRVRQAMVSERLPTYLSELASRYPIQWQIPDRAAVIGTAQH
jgi:parvulin-like peptidyl-prolyl isomerase